MSCDTKSNGHNVPSNATGYTIDSSANTDLVIKASNALINNDTTAYKSCYSSDAIFHDNNDSANLTQNVAGIQAMHDKGIVWKLNKIGAIWETVDLNPKANEKGLQAKLLQLRFLRLMMAIFQTRTMAISDETKVVIDSQLSRCLTARGSCTGFVTVGLT